MGKSILVTGGAGYIGAHACKALAKAGYEPVAYDNLVYGHQEAVRWGPFVEGDIGDRVKVAETIRRHSIGAVMHFAAFAYVGESVEKPEKYFQNNVVNTLGDARSDARDRGEADRLLLDLRDLRPARADADPRRHAAASGQSLWRDQAHDRARALLVWRRAWICARSRYAISTPPAPIPMARSARIITPRRILIPLILDAATGRRPHIGVFGTDYPTPDGSAIRDYIHVQDLADAHVRALRYLE